MPKATGNKNFESGEKKEKMIAAKNGNDGFRTKENEKNKKALPDTVDIKIESFNLPLEGKDLIVNARLLITSGKRYGLVGSRSCGKTALLEYIANRKLGIPSDLDVVYWNKEIIEDSEVSVFKAVTTPSIKCAQLIAEREQLHAKMEKGDGEYKDEKRLIELWEMLLMMDPEEPPAEAKAETILHGLGISDEWKTVQDIPDHFRKRVSLARALYLAPTLLLLDEVTTELDLEAILWLENYLQDWEKTLIVVSQDRCFLDNVCNEIIQIDQQKLFYYPGNFSFFELSARRQRRCAKKKQKKLQKKLQLKANMESKKVAVESQNGAMSRNLRQFGIEMNNDIEEGRATAHLLGKPRFSFVDPTEFKKMEFVGLSNVTFGYEKERPLFVNLRLGYSRKKKVAVIGRSGVGKSTLLRIASTEIQTGEKDVQDEPVKVESQKQLRFGRFDQNIVDQLPAEESPLEYLIKSVEKDGQKAVKETVVQQLNCLGLGNDLHTVKMKDLSAGEKARVVLAEFCLTPHDALFLDEPTKHLDIEFIDALAHAISTYKGGVMMVTSNECLIREPECELCLIEDQDVTDIVDLDEYRKKLLTELNEPIRGPFVYNRKIPAKPDKILSDSEIINKYLKNNADADPSICEIGKYKIIFTETTNVWVGYSPTLGSGSFSSGKTKEICRKKVYETIENYLEDLIQDKREVPSPP